MDAMSSAKESIAAPEPMFAATAELPREDGGAPLLEVKNLTTEPTSCSNRASL